MPEFNVAKALRSNPIYARQLRWIDRFSFVVDALGMAGPPLTAVDFATAVASWQRTKKLKDDGMLGPNTWGKLKHHKSTPAAIPVPPWLYSVPDEGWQDAVLSTLRTETSFLKIKTKSHHIVPGDFLEIADLIEAGTIELFTIKAVGSYEFRNDEPDANSMKVSRRARFGWRRAQATIVHEACHAISDVKGVSKNFLDEESVAYVVQLMFLEHFHARMPTDTQRRRLYAAAQRLAQRYLAGESPSHEDPDWKDLRQIIRHHPVYVERLATFPTLEFDGVL